MTRGLFFALLVLVGLLTTADAAVSHVSIYKRQFTLGQYPRLRVNLVSDSSDLSRLEFVLRQRTQDEKLMVEVQNRYLLLLTGVENVTDAQARLVVREYSVNRWHEVVELPLFDSPTSSANPGALAGLAPSKQDSGDKSRRPAIQSKGRQAQSRGNHGQQASELEPKRPAQVSGCSVDYQVGETLWRIAARYAPRWQSNVYGTMLALHQANPGAFYRGKIAGLKRGARLDCPSRTLLATFADASAARQAYETLSRE